MFVGGIATALLTAATFVGCSSKVQSSVNPEPAQYGTALFKLAAAANSPFARIAKTITLTISASDMNTLTRSLTKTDSTVAGTVTGIPAGKSRLFKVDVYDSNDVDQYTGATTANVMADDTVPISITVSRISGGVSINGTVLEDPSLPTHGLLAYYPFTGNANDMSGNGYNGAVGGATPAADRFGNANSAYYFDGIDDSISTNLDLNTANSFAVSVWFVNKKASNSGIIITDASCAGTATGGFSIGVVGLQVNTQVMLNSWTGTTTGTDSTIWHNIIMVYNHGLGRLQQYYDGVKTGDTAVSTPINPSLPVTIGRSIACASWGYFQGYVDDIRIYSDTLSAADISALYHEGGWTGN